MLLKAGWIPFLATLLTAYDPCYCSGSVRSPLQKIFANVIHANEDFFEEGPNRLTENMFLISNPPWADWWLQSFYKILLLWGGPFLLILPENVERNLSFGEFKAQLENKSGFTTEHSGLQKKYKMQQQMKQQPFMSQS